MHVQDVETIQGILGVKTLPPSVEREAELRTWMLSRCGLSRPLGPAMLVDMLRSMGCAPTQPDPKPVFDVKKLKPGDAVAVQGRPAEYVGITAGFAHAVRLPGVKDVQEVPGYHLGPVEEEAAEEPPVDWGAVAKGTPVVAILEEDGQPVDAQFMKVDGDLLKVRPDGEQKHYTAHPDNVAIA